jgi:hypothetical protein
MNMMLIRVYPSMAHVLTSIDCGGHGLPHTGHSIYFAQTIFPEPTGYALLMNARDALNKAMAVHLHGKSELTDDCGLFT